MPAIDIINSSGRSKPDNEARHNTISYSLDANDGGPWTQQQQQPPSNFETHQFIIHWLGRVWVWDW